MNRESLIAPFSVVIIAAPVWGAAPSSRPSSEPSFEVPAAGRAAATSQPVAVEGMQGRDVVKRLAALEATNARLRRQAAARAQVANLQAALAVGRAQEFHRQLFCNFSQSLREEIKRITGVEVREAVTEVEPTTEAVVQAFTSSAMVQVFRLARSVLADTWSGSGSGDQPLTEHKSPEAPPTRITIPEGKVP